VPNMGNVRGAQYPASDARNRETARLGSDRLPRFCWRRYSSNDGASVDKGIARLTMQRSRQKWFGWPPARWAWVTPSTPGDGQVGLRPPPAICYDTSSATSDYLHAT